MNPIFVCFACNFTNKKGHEYVFKVIDLTLFLRQSKVGSSVNYSAECGKM